MSKFTRIPGGLRGLALLSRTKLSSETVAESVANLRSRAKPIKAAAVARREAREARKARMDVEERTLLCCPVCGDDTWNDKQAAVVLFKLANGKVGTIAKPVCLHHETGDSWHGVGTIESITRQGVTLTRDRGNRPFYSIPTNTPKVENKPTKVNKPSVKLTKAQKTVLMELRDNHVNSDAHKALNSKPMAAFVEAETAEDVAEALLNMRAHPHNYGDWPSYSLPTKADGSAHKAKLNTLTRAMARYTN